MFALLFQNKWWDKFWRKSLGDDKTFYWLFFLIGILHLKHKDVYFKEFQSKPQYSCDREIQTVEGIEAAMKRPCIIAWLFKLPLGIPLKDHTAKAFTLVMSGFLYY